MPKQLVTVLGLVMSLGVIALGVFLVALPLYFQAVSVDSETATVASTNDLYATQVETLRAEEENLESINASVERLHAQIPVVAQLDDVFEVVGRAAEESGLPLTGVTAGDQVAFVVRLDASEVGVVDGAPEPAPAPDDPANVAPADGTTTTPTDSAATPDGSTPEADVSGRQQVDFVITATAADMAQVTAFLDALRSGPRLLSSIQVITAQTGDGAIDLQVTALTYVDSEGDSE